MAVLKTYFNSNPNVGLYGYANNEYCLLAREVKEKDVKEVEKTLNVKVHQINICGTSLLGVFLAGNDKCLLVPGIAFERELKALDKIGIKYAVIETDHTALGNNVVANDKVALVHPEIEEKARKRIGDALGVKVKEAGIGDLPTVGSLICFNKSGAVVSEDVKDYEYDFLEKSLNVDIVLSSVNGGSPYINSGIIVNDTGFIIGGLSNPVEVNEADKAFGFLEK